MKRYQKIIIGLAALSTMALGEGTITDRFSVYKVDDFSQLNSVPSFSLGAPAGLAGGFGGAFIGVSGITDKDDTDGGMSIGMGYGDPNKIGGNVSLGIGSIDPVDGGALNRGALNISAGHNFREHLIGVSVGVNSINLWHDNGEDYDKTPSIYVATTKLLANERFPMAMTLGFGNNNYAKVNESGDKDEHFYPFLSGAVYVMPQLSLIADYTSDIVTLGIGVVPFPDLPVSLTFGAYDVGHERDEDKVSFIGSLSVSFAL
ncbi:MAG: hypothetical protein WCQ76_06965 [Fusobacterium sp.]